MSQHQPEPDPLKPDPPHQASDAEPLPTPAEESAGYLFSYYYVPSVTAYHSSEAGDLHAIETYKESESVSPDVILVETTEQTWTYSSSLDPDNPEPQP
jgi:hypothetical protein